MIVIRILIEVVVQKVRILIYPHRENDELNKRMMIHHLRAEGHKQRMTPVHRDENATMHLLPDVDVNPMMILAYHE